MASWWTLKSKNLARWIDRATAVKRKWFGESECLAESTLPEGLKLKAGTIMTNK